jgi:predicted O-methyltransferase YrrM
MMTLEEYYSGLGYGPDQWHIGQEHPHLENFAIYLLKQLRTARVLEIGYQAGGFAVPLILEMRKRRDFHYVGIDNGAYPNAVDPQVIVDYLKLQNVTCDFNFHRGDAKEVLGRLAPQEFDLILVDHYKPLYFREFYEIASKRFLAPGGYILFHDVTQKAEKAWRQCKFICRAFGFSWQIVETVPGGLAVAERSAEAFQTKSLAQVAARVELEVLRGSHRLQSILAYPIRIDVRKLLRRNNEEGQAEN